jgi:peroxiredoxin Q/BCP
VSGCRSWRKDYGRFALVKPFQSSLYPSLLHVGFRDNIQAIKDAGFTVYGLSGDSPKSLTNWKAKQNLPFDLLSDPEHELISYFGSSLPGKKVQRSHVVVLKGGVVGDVQPKVSPADSVSRAVKFVTENAGEPAKVEEPAKEEEPTDAAPEKLAEGSTVTFDGELQTDASETVKVQDLFKTRGAIFFMYPKADTPGCTTQACGFNDNLEAINAAGFDVYGLGADTPAELLAWKESQTYKYTLLSDPKHQLIGYFGSSINDGTRVERSHVIVLPGGTVGQIEHNVSPQDSVSKGLAFATSHAIDATSKL